MTRFPPARVATLRSLRGIFLAAVLVALVFHATSIGHAAPAATGRTAFTRSAGPMPAHIAATARPLSAAHLAETMDLGVRLTLRHEAELNRRVNAGEVLSNAELDARYLPLKIDYDAVINWLKGEGFTITHTDDTHMGVFFSGTVAQVQKSFQTKLVRVTVEGTEFSAANTAPSLPAGIAAPVLGVVGLQPYIRLRPHHRGLQRLGPVSAVTAAAVRPADTIGAATTYPIRAFTPPQILTAFNGGSLSYTGSGQRIAIIADTTPGTYNSTTGVSTPNSDLQAFWANYVPGHTGGYEQVVPTGIKQATTPAGTEVSLDAQWSSGMAPAATVRVYAAGTADGSHVSFSDFEICFQQVINDIKAGTPIQQLSISYGGNESASGSSFYMQDDGSYFTVLASKGVSCFVSSGDGGSGSVSGGVTSYATEYFSTSPHVTAVGGTTLAVNADGTRLDETVWNNTSASGSGGATGGGTSIIFSRPVWQTGSGVPYGSNRLVPDVALPADPNTGATIVLTVNSKQGAYRIGGTSWSSPTWAGFCARINQARAAQLPARGTLCLLPPRLYPLLAAVNVPNFFDITTGNNNYYSTTTQYSATTGYDECTGIGTPNMANLLGTLTGPAITSFSPSSGPVGSPVVITGQNLNIVSSVAFNGVGTAFTVNSATQITATVPYGAATGTIVVSNPALATGTAGDFFTSTTSFTVTPAPDMKIVSSHSGNFTEGDNGDTYTLTAANVGTASTSGIVAVTDALDTASAYIVSASGTGWTCVVSGSGTTRTATCTRSDVLAAGASYPAITLTVNVNPNGNQLFNNGPTVAATGDADTGNDFFLDSTTVNSATVTPTRVWRYQYFGTTANTGNAADTANPSGDGLNNLIKYALGLDPTVPGITTVTEDTTTGYLSLTVPKNTNATDVTYAIQVTTDLTDPASWTTNGTKVDQDSLTTLQAHDTTPISDAPKQFIRLQVTR